DFRQAGGTVEMRHTSSPFTAAVDSEGHHEYTLIASLDNLQDPRDLGRYTTYVAWVTTPSLAPEIKLGEVREGRTRLGVVAFNKFIVMITAESSARVTTRRGRMLLRANSPSWLLLPHDAARLPAQSTDLDHSRMVMGGWVMPPMHPQVPVMIAGLEPLTPDAAPWVPSDTGAIPMVRPSEVVTVRDGDSLHLTAGLVRRTVAARTVTMYGFNGRSPGPLLRVVERSTIVVNFTNHLDQPTTIHWHGVR